MHCTGPNDGSRVWRTAEAVHVDLRGRDAPDPLVTILGMIDGGEVDGLMIAHFDDEPIQLYPELDERGWSHDFAPAHCGPDHGFSLSIARYGR